jgi:DNA-binding NarL/FixJ family response regulator
MTAEAIRVFVVDDHEVVRLGLRAFLQATPGVQVVGEAADGRAALEGLDALAARDALPDVVLMDLVMPEPDGITTAAVKQTYPGVEVVVVTSFGEAHRVHSAL